MKPSLETGTAAIGGITTVVNIDPQYGRAASPCGEPGAALRARETMVPGSVGPPGFGRYFRR